MTIWGMREAVFGRDFTVMSPLIFQKCGIHNTAYPAVQQLSLKSIQTATGNFKTLIGEGGFGAVYQGTLPHGQEVAVKV